MIASESADRRVRPPEECDVGPDELKLEAIRGNIIPGVQTGPGGTIVPIYTTAATGPEVTHYLVEAVDSAISLLREARSAVSPDLQRRIDDFIDRV
jgi:hypothetical protein